MEKLISVIVTAYNIENYISRCLDSLIGQSYDNMEIIVVDDGSSDKTGGICDCYAEKYKNVRVIHQPGNLGVAEARNTGVAAANGDYIGFVDGDDWAEPDMYGEMLKACEETDSEMAVCSYRQQRNGEERRGEEAFSGQKYVLTGEEALEVYICDNRPWHIYHSVWSKLFRRDVMEGLTFPAGRESEDIMYTTRALLKIQRCVFMDVPYYNYLVNRETSIMNHKLKERRFKDEIPFWKEQVICLEEAGFLELSQKASYHFYRTMLFYYVDFRDRKMKEAERELTALLRGEKEDIWRIYQKEFVATGDRVRMRMMLTWPEGYYLLVKGYDGVVIPLRHALTRFGTLRGKK